VTAILNTNAFWAYLLSVWMGSAPWHPKRLLAVVIAVVGVFFIVYGGTTRAERHPPTREGNNNSTSTELLGDSLTLLASVTYALYQATYKRYVALPNHVEIDDDKVQTIGYEPLPVDSRLLPHGTIHPGPGRRASLSVGSEPSHVAQSDDEDVDEVAVYPAFGLHPNFITTCLGVTTLLFLWPPIIIFHYTGIETFRLPGNVQTWVSVFAVCLCGVAYNAGFMVRSSATKSPAEFIITHPYLILRLDHKSTGSPITLGAHSRHSGKSTHDCIGVSVLKTSSESSFNCALLVVRNFALISLSIRTGLDL
jgi:hypothetical protein